VASGCLDLWGSSMRGDFTKEAQGVRLVFASDVVQ